MSHRNDVLRRREAAFIWKAVGRRRKSLRKRWRGSFLCVEDYSSRVCEDVRGGAKRDVVLSLAERPPLAARKGRLARIHAPAGARARGSGALRWRSVFFGSLPAALVRRARRGPCGGDRDDRAKDDDDEEARFLLLLLLLLR